MKLTVHLDEEKEQLLIALLSILQLDLPREQRRRLTWDEFFMMKAISAAMRSSCPRAKVGAVLVSEDHRDISSGYCGAPPKTPNCLEAGCRVIGGHCLRTVHAELNALLFATRETQGSTLYCTHKPCVYCVNDLLAAGVREIVYLIPYRAEDEESRFADEQLAHAGAAVRQFQVRELELGGE